MKSLSRNWKIFLILAFVAGAILRLIYVNDMEYKEDEEFNFTQTQIVRGFTDWPWVGMPSGVYLQNPGMSIWVFIALAKIFRVTQPTELAHAVQLFSLLGIAMIIPFVLWFVRTEEREPWLWAFVFSLVNPFAILYQRKLWPEPFLPFFTMLVLMGWWRRDRKPGAFVWGFIGAWLGQIHMSGFFFAAGLFLWTLFFDRSTGPPESSRRPRWKFWFIGSCLGALPLIPWFLEVLAHPPRGHMVSGISEALQLKYWVFWITDALGLHLGNPLGLLRGQSNFAQISDFIRYPLINGQATYLVGLAHIAIVIGALIIVYRAVRGVPITFAAAGSVKSLFIGQGSPTAFVQSAALWGTWILLTITGVAIRRYYMMVTFPLEFVWLARITLGHGQAFSRFPRAVLGIIWTAQLFISANFVGYIHVNEGAVQGDYGPAYHVIMKQRK